MDITIASIQSALPYASAPQTAPVQGPDPTSDIDQPKPIAASSDSNDTPSATAGNPQQQGQVVNIVA